MLSYFYFFGGQFSLSFPLCGVAHGRRNGWLYRAIWGNLGAIRCLVGSP